MAGSFCSLGKSSNETRPGKHTKKLWTITLFLGGGKFTISMVIFHSFVCLPEGKCLVTISYFSYKEGHRMLVPPKQNNQTNPS